MAILIELQYGKKLGLPEFSSHNFNVSLKTEVARLEDVRGEVERVYRLLQEAVDAQIVHPGFVPGSEAKPPSGNNKSVAKTEPAALPANAEPPKADTAKASNKQIKYALDLAKNKGLTLSGLNARVQSKFGVESIYELARKDASKLVDELKAAA